MVTQKLTHKQQAAIQQRLEYLRRVTDFDARREGSRMTEEQQEAMDCICSYKIKNVFVTGGNRSGKSQMLRRLVAWFLAEPEEAQWKRRPEWVGPLQGLLVSKSHKQLTGSLVDAIKPFFEGDPDFRIIRSGNYIERLEHRRTGNVLWCFVHENAGQCRERVQSFASQMILLDELPSGPNAFRLFEELSARVTDSKGVMGAFFTPKSINPQIKSWVENMEPPAGRKFSLSFINNPGIDQEAKESRLAEIHALPEHMRETLLKGSWMNAENAVFTLPDEALDHPSGYSHLWRHVVSVDPGLASAQGVVVAAESPSTGRWYTVHAEKMSKITDVDDAVERVWQLIQKNNWNVCQIAYDPAGTYWRMQAKKHPGLKNYKIVCPFDKNSTERKAEMIANMQIALGTKIFILPSLEDLLDEFATCAWSDTVEGKIKKGQKFHLLDAIRYLIDTLPKFTGVIAKPEEDAATARAKWLRTNQEKWSNNTGQSHSWRNPKQGGRIVGISRMITSRR
jgi:hypothetical protein